MLSSILTKQMHNFVPYYIDWIPKDQVKNIPSHVLYWLNDKESLTLKLKKKYKDFHVDVQNQTEGKPYPNEIDLLDSIDNYIIREVILYGNNSPVVYAISIIPKNNETYELLNIGNQPLGEILFTNPNISRGPIEITCHNDIWGRRSVFIMNNSRILVSEFFLEKIYA